MRKTKVITKEMLSQPTAGEVILELIRDGVKIDNETQVKILTLENWREILLTYVQYRPLCFEAMRKVFSSENVTDSLVECTQRIWFDEEDELELFKLKNREEILLECVKKGSSFRDEAQIKFFSLNNAVEILLEYIKYHALCKEAELKIFDMPADEAVKILLEYIKQDHYLCVASQKKIFDLPADKAAKILLEYVKHWSLSPDVQIRVFSLGNDKAAEILLEYVRNWKLCKEAQKLYDRLREKSQM